MDRTQALIVRAQQGDKAASEQLVLENAGLIWSIARRYFGRGVEPDDLYQLGALGFLKAIAGFDTQYGTQFSTYAVPKIAGEIRRFLRDDGAVKVSRSVKERAAVIKKERQRLTGELGREPTLSELSQSLDLSVEEIASAETATSSAESIQRQTGEEGITLEDVLAGPEMEDSNKRFRIFPRASRWSFLCGIFTGSRSRRSRPSSACRRYRSAGLKKRSSNGCGRFFR